MNSMKNISNISKKYVILQKGNGRNETRTQSFQYRRDFDAFKDFIEHYWSLKVKRAKQTIRDHTGPNGNIQDHTGPYMTIQDHTGPYGTIQDHTGP